MLVSKACIGAFDVNNNKEIVMPGFSIASFEDVCADTLGIDSGEITAVTAASVVCVA